MNLNRVALCAAIADQIGMEMLARVARECLNSVVEDRWGKRAAPHEPDWHANRSVST